MRSPKTSMGNLTENGVSVVTKLILDMENASTAIRNTEADSRQVMDAINLLLPLPISQLPVRATARLTSSAVASLNRLSPGGNPKKKNSICHSKEAVNSAVRNATIV